MLAPYFVAAAILLGLVAIARAFVRFYLKYRGDRLITCPENHRPAGVNVDAVHILLTTTGAPNLRLKSCSRWSEREDCGQECLGQIEASPDDCLVRNILTRWYEGKTCALCGNLIGEIQWSDHKPALMSRDHQTVQWWQVRAEDVPDVLASSQAVCWNCHVVNRMVIEHPELVVDRSRHA